MKLTNEEWDDLRMRMTFLTAHSYLRETFDDSLLARRPEAPAPTCAVCGNTLGCVSCSNERKAAHAQNSCDNSSEQDVIAVPSCVPAPCWQRRPSAMLAEEAKRHE
jgi:hypothetical protein